VRNILPGGQGAVRTLRLACAALALAAASVAAPAAAQAATPQKAQAPERPHAAALGAAKARAAKQAVRAHASLCATAPMSGDWHNIDPSTRSMTRAVVDFTCGDQILCDLQGHCTGGVSSYFMHMYGACHPTACDWGRLQAFDQGGGWIRSIYTFGFASVHVWLKTYQYYGLTYLRVWTYTDFTPSDGRTDYTTDEWMLR
jgi:hypothetical protein